MRANTGTGEREGKRRRASGLKERKDGEEDATGEERGIWQGAEDVARRGGEERDGWVGGWEGRRGIGGWVGGGIISGTGAVFHSPGKGTLSLFNWIWVSCCLSAHESPSAPSQLSKPS